jgi:Fe-S-cluster containining protein
MRFNCSQCGECCRHLDRSALYRDLDRGDGVCRYLDGDLCSIYDTRPLLCRVDESYAALFSEIYTEEEYYRLNEEACKSIRSL